MSWVFSELRNNVSFHRPPLVQGVLGPLPSSSPLPSSPPPPYDQNFENKLSPSILLIIIILAVMFFISGLLHLLVRLLARPQRRESDDLDNVTVLQGQLQQLFHLHDAGVDQSHMDTLPVFLYKSIIGAKNPFDCAVCLCEFEPEDKLRLLPKCSHAFHLECIDTWLLSHSTCPLCRGSLLTDFSSGNCSQVVFVLQSGGESTPEIVERDVRESSFSDTGMNLEDGFMPENSQKMLTDVPAKDEPKVVPVKLGKLKMTGRGGGGGGARTESVRIGGESSRSISNVDSRRCYSMGSFEYVLDEASLLKVPIVSMRKKPSVRKATLHQNPPHTPSTSMCDVSKASHSRREGFRITDQSLQGGSSAIHEGKGESFSVSKIWLRSKKDKPSSCGDSSRRASSFRLPMGRVDLMKAHEKDGPEIVEIEGCTNQDDACSSSPRSECGTDQLYHGRSSLDSLTNKTPSFARKTLHWIAGRQNRTHSAPFAPV